ncbi:unnamed protein product [Nyctereutes procyonoides]|uniref:(raccoon dog) hypothetical protein n=1 Tax=Nyctereutes procyonoides TaxID=34880 RepID=A0A811Z7E4_NYCPR|nr:unnamed protein product [Nyctereutes procyonoides]
MKTLMRHGLAVCLALTTMCTSLLLVYSSLGGQRERPPQRRAAAAAAAAAAGGGRQRAPGGREQPPLPGPGPRRFLLPPFVVLQLLHFCVLVLIGSLKTCSEF